MKKHKILSVLLAFLFFVFAVPFFGQKTEVNAETPTRSVFNGIALTQTGTGSGGVMLEQYALSTRDLSNAKYLAIRYHNPMDTAWPFYIICQQNGGFIYLADSTPYSIYDDNFQLIENKQVAANAIAPTPMSSGYIVLPANAFPGMETIEAFYIKLAYGTATSVELHLGKVGYYTETNPDLAMDMITLTDFSTWTEEWFNGRTTDPGVTALSIVSAPATGLIGGVQITQASCPGYLEPSLMVNRFNTSTVYSADISNVTYFAFEYANVTTAGSATRIIMQDSTGFQAAVSTGANLTYLNQDFSYAKDIVTANPYIYADANASGWIVIPKSAFEGLGDTLVANYLVWVVYDAALNGASWQFGRILTYTEETITDYSKGTLFANPGQWQESVIKGNVNNAAISVERVQAPEYMVTKTVNGVTKSATFDVGTSYTPATPKKAGSAFIGWSVNSVYTTNATVSATSSLEALFVDFTVGGIDAKTTGTQGLRFYNSVSAESKAMLQMFGLTATYGTRLTNPSLGYLNIPVVNWFDAEETMFTAVLKGFGDAHYTLEFTAQAYVEINGVKYYADATQVDSFAHVAYATLQAGGLTQEEIDYLTPIAAKYAA